MDFLPGELCLEKTRVLFDSAFETLVCTLPKYHEGSHYDSVFTREW